MVYNKSSDYGGYRQAPSFKGSGSYTSSTPRAWNYGAPARYGDNRGVPLKWAEPNPENKWYKDLGSAKRRVGRQALGKLLRKLNPAMRTIDLAFQLLDLWTVTSPGGMTGDGWYEVCRLSDGPYTDFHGPVYRNENECKVALDCSYVGQTVYGQWEPGTVIEAGKYGDCLSEFWCEGIPKRFTGTAAVAFGPGYGIGTSRRMDFHLVMATCWDRCCSGYDPRPPAPLVYSPRVVQPSPISVTPPDPLERTNNQPRVRPRLADKRGPAGHPRTAGSPRGVTPRKNPPPYVVDGEPQLPGKERKKWKLTKGGRVGDFYGTLTELGDGLECYEKALGIRRKGGLHERLLRAASATADGYKRDWNFVLADFIGCLIVSNAGDYVIGKANKLANRITSDPYYVRPVGVGRGGFVQRMR